MWGNKERLQLSRVSVPQAGFCSEVPEKQPRLFFFILNACKSVPTAVGKPDQLTDPKKNKLLKTPAA